MNSYHFMNFPASPRSWPVRPPSWASASRGCHLGGFYHGIGGFSQGFSHDFPRCVQDLWRKSSEIWSDFGSDAGFCWTVRNCRFGSFGSCWDGFWRIHWSTHSMIVFSGHGPGCFGHGLEDVLTCSTCSTMIFCWKMLNPLWCCNFNISKQNCIVADISIFFWHQAFTNIWEAFVSVYKHIRIQIGHSWLYFQQNMTINIPASPNF